MEQVNVKVFLYSENEDQCLEVQKFYLSPAELCIYDLKEKLDALFQNQSFKIFLVGYIYRFCYFHNFVFSAFFILTVRLWKL